MNDAAKALVMEEARWQCEAIYKKQKTSPNRDGSRIEKGEPTIHEIYEEDKFFKARYGAVNGGSSLVTFQLFTNKNDVF